VQVGCDGSEMVVRVPLFFGAGAVSVSGVDAGGSCCDFFPFFLGAGRGGFRLAGGEGSSIMSSGEGRAGPLETMFEILDAAMV